MFQVFMGFITKVVMGILVQFDVKETETGFRKAHTQLYGLLQKYDKNSH